MTALDEEITALKGEIVGYVSQLNEAGIPEARWNRLSDMIKTGRETLNLLLEKEKVQSAGKCIYLCSSKYVILFDVLLNFLCFASDFYLRSIPFNFPRGNNFFSVICR